MNQQTYSWILEDELIKMCQRYSQMNESEFKEKMFQADIQENNHKSLQQKILRIIEFSKIEGARGIIQQQIDQTTIEEITQTQIKVLNHFQYESDNPNIKQSLYPFNKNQENESFQQKEIQKEVIDFIYSENVYDIQEQESKRENKRKSHFNLLQQKQTSNEQTYKIFEFNQQREQSYQQQENKQIFENKIIEKNQSLQQSNQIKACQDNNNDSAKSQLQMGNQVEIKNQQLIINQQQTKNQGSTNTSISMDEELQLQNQEIQISTQTRQQQDEIKKIVENLNVLNKKIENIMNNQVIQSMKKNLERKQIQINKIKKQQIIMTKKIDQKIDNKNDKDSNQLANVESKQINQKLIIQSSFQQNSYYFGLRIHKSNSQNFNNDLDYENSNSSSIIIYQFCPQLLSYINLPFISQTFRQNQIQKYILFKQKKQKNNKNRSKQLIQIWNCSESKNAIYPINLNFNYDYQNDIKIVNLKNEQFRFDEQIDYQNFEQQGNILDNNQVDLKFIQFPKQQKYLLQNRNQTIYLFENNDFINNNLMLQNMNRIQNNNKNIIQYYTHSIQQIDELIPENRIIVAGVSQQYRNSIQKEQRYTDIINTIRCVSLDKQIMMSIQSASFEEQLLIAKWIKGSLRLLIFLAKIYFIIKSHQISLLCILIALIYFIFM